MDVVMLLKELSENPTIKQIITQLSDNNYNMMPFAEKKLIYKNFVSVVANKSGIDVDVMFNKDSDDGDQDIVFSQDTESIIMNGLDKNPYIYLKDILINVLLYAYSDYEIINVGDVYFDCDYNELIPNFVQYSTENINLTKKVVKFMDEVLKDISNEYKDEYELCFDRTITEEAISEIAGANKTVDEYVKDIWYYKLKEIEKYLISKDTEITKEYLALFSLNQVILKYIYKSEEDSSYKTILNKNMNLFVHEFFPEYENELNITINKRLIINNYCVQDDDIVLDILMQQIDKIEKANPRIDSLISDEELTHFNKKGDDFKKIDVYFLKKLKYLDSLLKGRGLEVINYFDWSKLYSPNKRLGVYDARCDMFEPLIEDETFISLVERLLKGRGKSNNLLREIFEMMNEIYHASNFKLEIDGNILASQDQGLSTDVTMYLNTRNIKDKITMIATFFHEYRHLMQYSEINDNNGLFNKKISKIIKLNCSRTSFGYDYAYYSIGTSGGYHNPLFYSMQPIEYDAEMFSMKIFKKILAKMKNPPIVNFDKYYNGCYSNSKFIDPERLSLLSYQAFVKLDKVKERIDYENKAYELLLEKIDAIDNYSAAIEVFKEPLFLDLDFEDKVVVYQLIAGEEVEVSYNEPKFIIKGKRYSIDRFDDFRILEMILIEKAKVMIKEGRLKFNMMNEYIYNESRKFKADEITIENYVVPYRYHSCFDKYYRLINKKNICKSKK